MHVTGGGDDTRFGDRVGGNIDLQKTRGSDAPREIVICAQMVPNGNIIVEKSREADIRVGGDAPACPPNDVPKGNLFLQENSVDASYAMAILGNRVGGNLQAFKTSGGGDKRVQGNTVAQDLQCKENSAPFVGRPNTAGDYEDQCAP